MIIGNNGNPINIGTGLSQNTSVGYRVDSTSPWYTLMSRKWEKINTLLGGTEAMRAAGVKYMPQFPFEPDDLYEYRRKAAVLTNFFRHMAEQMVGKIFSKQIEIKTQVPQELLNDIDRQGSSIHSFARQICFDLVTKGMAHVFVDYPVVEGRLTRKQVRESNIRPFWVHVHPDNLFAAATSRFNDHDNLSQVRWFEVASEVAGFEEREYKRIRVITEKLLQDESGDYITDENGRPIISGLEYQIWEDTYGRLFPPRSQNGLPPASSGGYALVKRGDFGLSTIPLVTSFSDRIGFYQSTIPLEDVAMLNILHWQQASDLNNIIRLSQAPLWFVKGFPEKPDTKGANVVYFVEGDGDAIQYADMKYVEPSGTGIEAGEKALQRIINDAQMIGYRMFERSRSVETATGEQLQKIEDASPLQLIALSLESQIKRCLDFTCEWLNLPKENEVKVNKDFAFTGDESKAADHLSLAWANGAITGKTYVEHLKEYGILKRNVDAEAEYKAGEAEFEKKTQFRNNVNIKTKEGLKGRSAGSLNAQKVGD